MKTRLVIIALIFAVLGAIAAMLWPHRWPAHRAAATVQAIVSTTATSSTTTSSSTTVPVQSQPIHNQVGSPSPPASPTTLGRKIDPPVYVLYPDGTCGQTGLAEAKANGYKVIPADKQQWCVPPYYADPYAPTPTTLPTSTTTLPPNDPAACAGNGPDRCQPTTTTTVQNGG